MFGDFRRKTTEGPWLPWYNKLPEDEDKASHERSEDYDALSSRWGRLKNWSSCLAIALACVVLFLASSVLFLLFQGSKTSGTFYPTLQTTFMKFEEHPIFMSEPSPESDAAWDSLIPSGRGFVLVEDPEKYHLRPGLPTELGPDRYSVSMFHQLHCLGILRESYYSAIHSTTPKIFGEDKLSGELLKHAHKEHIGHCFDYLRQAIMCAGDLTLEWAARTASGVTLQTVDGWGITHQCHSWDQAFQWTLEHKAPHNFTGIA